MNIIMFGPNGSGKGTFGKVICDRFKIPQIETGVIFRDNIKKGTDLGKKAKGYIDEGALVPDEITIPMILDRLKEADCKDGWLLDGFPRNITQAEAFWDALVKANIKLDSIVEILLSREMSKKRIMGRRLCPVDNNHPNNIYVPANMPVEKNGELFCRVCGSGGLTSRADDQDEAAIDKRHNIYFDEKTGTLAAVNYFKSRVKVIELDTAGTIKEISDDLLKKLS
jgi:adenylate kinase